MGHSPLKALEPVARSSSTKELGELVRRAQAGDEGALSSLIESTQDRLMGFFLYLTRQRQLAEDLAQDTFIRAFENIGKLKNPDTFLSWLFATGRNVFLAHVRLHKNSRTVLMESLPDLVEGTEGGGNGVGLDIARAMAPLDPEDRVLLLLVDNEGYSYEEAAKIIGLSEAALRSRLHRARKAFAENYKSS